MLLFPARAAGVQGVAVVWTAPRRYVGSPEPRRQGVIGIAPQHETQKFQVFPLGRGEMWRARQR